MVTPRGAIPDLQIGVRFAHSPRDMLFDGLHRDAQAVRHLLVRIFVKYAQRKRRAALRRQSIDSLLYEPVAFIPQQSGFQGLTLDVDLLFIEARQCAALHHASMAKFVCCQIARSGAEESPEREDRLTLP